jgi:hypothetical protein
VRPVTTADVTVGPTTAVWPPGWDVTVCEVIALPPSSAEGVHVTVACVLPGVAVTPVGAAGAEGPGTTAFDGGDLGPVPFAFVASTVNV